MVAPALFFPSTSPLGQVGKPYSSATNWEISPRKACRELIQNALDAHVALPEKHNNPCKVIFKVGRIKVSDIPGIDTYRKALTAGLQKWKSTSSVKNYLVSLRNYSEEASLEVIYVSDNGIGFDNKTLEAVLSEGTPEKQSGSSGSFGIGHLTTFGLSGLQYIFYASKSSSDELLCAGHAILASYRDSDDNTYRSEHGYFLNKYTPDFFDQPYEFCTGRDNIPSFLLTQLDTIETSGSVIAVLGFKGFRDSIDDEHKSPSLGEIICEAVAENFAIAISAKTLEVEVHTDSETQTINQSSIIDFLKQKDELSQTDTKETTREAQLTLDAIEAYQESRQSGQSGRLQGKFHDCQIYLRNRMAFHCVSIWRNGMLITRTHRGLSKGMFDNKKPLHAVVFLSGQEEYPVAHDLVKKAENPMHDKIEEKRLASSKEKMELKSFFNETRKWINDRAEEAGGKNIDLDDEIVLDTGETDLFKLKDIKPKDDDEPEGDDEPEAEDNEDTREPSDQPPDKPSAEVKPQRKVTRKNRARAKIQGRIKNQSSYMLRIVPNENIKRALLQVTRDNGQDPSCTRRFQDTLLEINKVTRSGDSNDTWNVKNHTVKLGNLKKNMPVDLELIFSQPLNDIDAISLYCLVGQDLDGK